MNKSDYRVVERRPTPEELSRVRKAAGLRVRGLEAAAKGIANSLFAVCVEHDGVCVGTGRVVGDGGMFFEIVDVAVVPKHQGKGLGKLIMETLMSYVRRNAPPASFVSLMADNAGLVKFYAAHGFEVRGLDRPAMFQRMP